MNAAEHTPPGASLLRQLDHVVLAVHDLTRASEDFRNLGFSVTPGGRHPGRTSHNALVVFADGAYLELIAWSAPAPEERWWRSLQAHGEGWVDHALLPSAVGPALTAAQARGLGGLRGPLPGGRTRPDGTRIEWETARHDTADVPFLCADLTPRSLRVPSGCARQHANGATGIAVMAVAAQDVAMSSHRWAALLGPGIPLNAWSSAVGLRHCGYTLGSTQFELVGLEASSPRAASARIKSSFQEQLRQRLLDRDASQGDGPIALRLHGPGPQRILDPSRCHGALICLGTASDEQHDPPFFPVP
ncbi:MAG: VOC family protein [Pseudomonadota bacterium]|jgi:hypothetical protein